MLPMIYIVADLTAHIFFIYFAILGVFHCPASSTGTLKSGDDPGDDDIFAKTNAN